MSIYHKHHIVPRHMGGTDDPSNLIELTIEEHAEAHKKLYEEYGLEEDRIAWLCLSGQITNAEANILATKAANSGKKLSKHHNKILQDAAKKSNKDRLENGTHNFLSKGFQSKVQKDRLEKGTHPFSKREKQREYVMMQIKSGNHMSYKKKTCAHCGITTNTGNYGRWHGDRCKKRGE